MRKPTLIYFQVRGRAELIRIILAQAGVDYVEHPVGKDLPDHEGRPTDFAALKRSGLLPFEAVPVWEEPDGFRLAQSQAIAIYLATTHGLRGKNAREAALCDQALGACEDVRAEVRKIALGPAEARPAFRGDLETQFLPRWLGFFDRLLAGNRDGTGFLVGDGVTYADLALFHMLELLVDNGLAGLDAHPRLAAHFKRVHALPRIVAYLTSPRRWPFAPLPR